MTEQEIRLTDEELQILEDVKPNKQATIKRQLLRARELKNTPIDERIKKEIKHRTEIGEGPGVVVTIPMNSQKRRSVDGRQYKGPNQETTEVRFIPFQTNFAQPGFAQRLLRKGAQVKEVFKPEVIRSFLTAIAGTDGAEHYRLNIETLESNLGNQKAVNALQIKTDSLAAENAELQRKLAELQGQKSETVKPRASK